MLTHIADLTLVIEPDNPDKMQVEHFSRGNDFTFIFTTHHNEGVA